MSVASLLNIQIEEIIKKRKQSRAVAALAIGIMIYLIVLIMVLILSTFIPPMAQLYAIILGALAGASGGMAFYLLENYPRVPENFIIYGEVTGDTSGLTGLDVYLVSQLARQGAIDVVDFARSNNVDKTLVVSRIISLENQGVIRVNNIKAL